MEHGYNVFRNIIIQIFFLEYCCNNVDFIPNHSKSDNKYNKYYTIDVFI